MLQNVLGRLEGQWGQIASKEKAGLVNVTACDQASADHLGTVEDNEICAARMLTAGADIQETCYPNFDTGFLMALALGSPGGVLASVNKASRESPLAAPRLIEAADKQHAAILLDQGSRGNFRISIVDPITLRTDRSYLAETLGLHDLRAAAQTIIYLVFCCHFRIAVRRRQ